MKKYIYAFGIVAFVLGCATIELKQQEQTQKLLAKTVVQYATLKVVKANEDLADDLITHLNIIDTMILAENPVEAIKAYAVDTVRDSSLAVEDKILCLNLIDIASESIVVVSNEQNIDTLTITKEVVSWVREALSLVEVD